MNLVSLILQSAIAIMTFVSANPGLPQWQHDQAVSIAQQALQFANQSGYSTNTNCSYPYTNCYNPNCTIYPYTNCQTNNTNIGNAQVSILGSENIDTSFVQNGQNYSILWSPFNTSFGYASVQLLSSMNGNVIQIGTMNGNTLAWTPSGLSPGSYTIRVLQQGAILGSRSITIQ